jgi:hypothetical protein
MILLLSGCTVTWAHHAILERLAVRSRAGSRHDGRCSASCSFALQVYEYAHAAFRLQGQRLLVDLLHGDGLPRLPRFRRHGVPDRLLGTRAPRATSRPERVISVSKPPPGTGTSSTWSGCSCSSPFTGGAIWAASITRQKPRPLQKRERLRSSKHLPILYLP